MILNCQSFLLSSYKEDFGFKKKWSSMFSFGISGHPETWIALEKLHGAIIRFKTSPQLLLQSCFAVKLQNCSVDNETPTDFPSAWGGGESIPISESTFLSSNHFILKLGTVKLPSCNKPVIHNVQKCSDSTSSVFIQESKNDYRVFPSVSVQ